MFGSLALGDDDDDLRPFFPCPLREEDGLGQVELSYIIHRKSVLQVYDGGKCRDWLISINLCTLRRIIPNLPRVPNRKPDPRDYTSKTLHFLHLDAPSKEPHCF